MRSDNSNGFERLVKLWISVWNLVLEGKRHLETVTALLQRIVFEEQGYPRFKNWPEICKIGETDTILMMVVASVDLEEPNEVAQQIVAVFPQCFSDTEVNIPVPLSVIREASRQNYTEGDPDFNADPFPVSFDAVPSHIPVQTFDKFGRNLASLNGPRLPAEISPDADQGDVVTWGGKQFVVLENNESCEELSIAPAECIRVDL